MPHPNYIICCQSSTIDEETSAVSLFHILDGITVTVQAGDDAGTGPQVHPQRVMANPVFRVVSSWMKTEEDDGPDSEFEFEVLMEGAGEELASFSSGKFRFNKDIQRFVNIIEKKHPWSQSGMLVITHRIRKVGDDSWFSQKCVVRIKVHYFEPESQSEPKSSTENAE